MTRIGGHEIQLGRFTLDDCSPVVPTRLERLSLDERTRAIQAPTSDVALASTTP